METFWEYFSVLAPSIGLGLIFWLAIRSLLRADSGERTAQREAEEREAETWARARGAQREAAPRNGDRDDGGAPNAVADLDAHHAAPRRRDLDDGVPYS